MIMYTELGGGRRTDGTNDARQSSKDGKWLLERIGKQMLRKQVERGNETPGYKRLSRLLSEPLTLQPGYPKRNLRQNVYGEHVTLVSFSDTHADSHSRKTWVFADLRPERVRSLLQSFERNTPD